MKSAPSDCLNKPVIKGQLGPVHWEKLEAINEALIAEYSTRRSMLLKRVDVTVASFNWSDRAKVIFIDCRLCLLVCFGLFKSFGESR